MFLAHSTYIKPHNGDLEQICCRAITLRQRMEHFAYTRSCNVKLPFGVFMCVAARSWVDISGHAVLGAGRFIHSFINYLAGLFLLSSCLPLHGDCMHG